MNVWEYQHWNTAITTLDIYLLFENGHKSTQTRCKVSSNLTNCTTTIVGVEIRFFVWPVIFGADAITLCWPIATKGFSGAVSPLSCPWWKLSSFQRQRSVWFVENQSFHFYSKFFFENNLMHCVLAPNTFDIQIRTRSTLSQSQYLKRLLNVIAHKYSIKNNRFIYPSIYQIKKHLFFMLVTIYWTSAPDCSKLALILSLTLRIIYL